MVEHTTENRGVPSSSLGLAIGEGPRQRRGPSGSRASRPGRAGEIHPVRHPRGACTGRTLMRDPCSGPAALRPASRSSGTRMPTLGACSHRIRARPMCPTRSDGALARRAGNSRWCQCRPGSARRPLPGRAIRSLGGPTDHIRQGAAEPGGRSIGQLNQVSVVGGVQGGTVGDHPGLDISRPEVPATAHSRHRRRAIRLGVDDGYPVTGPTTMRVLVGFWSCVPWQTHSG